MIVIEVKHDTKHIVWHRLSARLHPQCPIDNIIIAVDGYMCAYAERMQLNVHQLAARAVDQDTGRVVHMHESYATQNHRKNNP